MWIYFLYDFLFFSLSLSLNDFDNFSFFMNLDSGSIAGVSEWERGEGEREEKKISGYNIIISLTLFSFHNCRVTDRSPHLDGNREWAQRAQYNKFVRESGLKNWANRFSRQLLGVEYLAEEAKTHEQAKILGPRVKVKTVLMSSNQVRGVWA